MEKLRPVENTDLPEVIAALADRCESAQQFGRLVTLLVVPDRFDDWYSKRTGYRVRAELLDLIAA